MWIGCVLTRVEGKRGCKMNWEMRESEGERERGGGGGGNE